MISPSFIRLSELSSHVSSAIEQAFGGKSFWVVADVTSHTYKQQTNYHYFELVEKDNTSNTIIAKFVGRAWGAGSQKIAVFEQMTGQQFGNDIHVLVNVLVEYHASYGLRLCVTDIDPNFTLGVLERQRQATLARLVAENPGYVSFDGQAYRTFNSNLILNRVIQRIAVLSSSTSAGFQDFMHTLENNGHGYRFFADHFVVLIHGENNGRQLVDKMIEIFHSEIKYDAVAIIRGGGAQTDFLLFNDYVIGRAVARFPVPVITGIGHQKNETITDLMAHTSTKTPTKAAEFIIAHNRKFEEEMLSFEKRIVIKSQQLLSVHAKMLGGLNSAIINYSHSYLSYYKDNLNFIQHRVINHSKSALYKHALKLQAFSSIMVSAPKAIINNRKSDLRYISANLGVFKGIYLRNRHSDLNHYISVIRLMSPENILKKGFAIVKTGDRITVNPDDIKTGDKISVLFATKKIEANVESKEDYEGSDFNI